MLVKPVIDAICTNLRTLPLLTKVGGLVKVAVKKNTEGVNILFPVVWNEAVTDCNASDEIDFVPDSSEKGIAYFELLNSQNTKKLAGVKEYEFRVRLVVWFDSRWVQDYSLDKVMGAVQSRIYKNYNLLGASHIRSTTVIFETDEPQTATIFSRYTYDETVKQYLRRPYDFFSSVYTIRLIVNSSCFDNITIKESLC